MNLTRITIRAPEIPHIPTNRNVFQYLITQVHAFVNVATDEASRNHKVAVLDGIMSINNVKTK